MRTQRTTPDQILAAALSQAGLRRTQAVSAARLGQLRDQRAGPLVFSMEDEKRRAYNEFFAARILSILTLEQSDQKREDLLADLLLLGVKAA